MENLRYQRQLFAHAPEDGVSGDCYPTALACVLGRPRAEIPHTHDQDSERVNDFYRRWFASQGLKQIYFPVLYQGEPVTSIADEMQSRGGDLPMLLTGDGGRGVNHVIIVYGPGDYWCPTLGKTKEVALLGPARPSDYFWAEWIVRAP